MITKVSQFQQRINNNNFKKVNQHHYSSSKDVSFGGLPHIVVCVAITGGVAVAAKFLSKNGKKIANVVKHTPEIVSKTVTKISEDIRFKGVETIINEAGKRVPKDEFRGEIAIRADEVPGISKYWSEIDNISARINAKINAIKTKSKSPEEFNELKQKMDLDYYKDSFRLGMTVPADKLKHLREADKEKFADVFEKCRLYFEPEDGVLIYGKNDAEKKKLLDYFIGEAKAHDIDVEYVSTKGVTSAEQIGEPLANAFNKAKQKFNELKRQTLLVIEDVDFILGKDGPSTRAIWNTKAQASGENGIITLTTAKDLNLLDDACTRGGRIRYKIDIDDALAKQAEIDKTK